MYNETFQILVYGEDSLTLWAIQNKLCDILNALNNHSDPGSCLVFYRPSFGLGGGPANFGEFDCIILSDQVVYLVECIWDRLKDRVYKRIFFFSEVQRRRHRLMRFYIGEWANGDFSNWEAFQKKSPGNLEELKIDKPIAPEESDLYKQLMHILGAIREKYGDVPPITNVLLFMHRGADILEIPGKASDNFEVVPVDYSHELQSRFVPI